MKTAKYFSATWCGPCKVFKPVMNEIAGEGYHVEFIDIDNLSDLAEKYNVPDYLKETLYLTRKRIEGVFGKDKEKQTGLADF